MSSKLFSILAVFVMLAMLLSACAQPAPAPAAPAAPAKAEATAAPAAKPAEQVEIRWRTRPDNQEEQDVYQKISDELQAKLPNIKLVYDPAPVQGYMDKLTTEYSAGTAPDITWMPGASVADYASKGVLLDLMPEVSKDPAFKLTDYYDAPMKELQHDGKLWGLPRDISTMVMYYNKDLLKAKGVEDPAELAAKGEWTWDNFLKASAEDHRRWQLRVQLQQLVGPVGLLRLRRRRQPVQCRSHRVWPGSAWLDRRPAVHGRHLQ